VGEKGLLCLISVEGGFPSRFTQKKQRRILRTECSIKEGFVFCSCGGSFVQSQNERESIMLQARGKGKRARCSRFKRTQGKKKFRSDVFGGFGDLPPVEALRKKNGQQTYAGGKGEACENQKERGAENAIGKTLIQTLP